MGSYNHQKKVTSSTSFRRSFLGRRLRSNLVEMVKNLTFDKKVGGGQPNLTQFMPIPHSNLKIGIGINWVKLARTGFFD